ncbi:MAG: DsbA family protein, partial [Alphaproteobacteria bacterium]|nr:DsbA family protein [Alphaproteobacteria bacterium]
SGHAAQSFNDDQRKEIEGIIYEYITQKNPDALEAGLMNLQKRKQGEAESKIKEKIGTEKQKIFNDPDTPFAGNPKPAVTVTWFYDYQCGYCKSSEDALGKILKEEKDVKVVYKQFPVLGPSSMEAAKAVLASAKQGKFLAFHSALMGKKEHLTSDSIYQTAKQAGVDVEKLKKEMADKKYDEALSEMVRLGQDLGVQGTPFFVINDSYSPGALQYGDLKTMIAEARKGKAP